MPAAGGNFEDFRGVLREKHVQNALMNVFLVQKRLQNAQKFSACGGHIIIEIRLVNVPKVYFSAAADQNQYCCVLCLSTGQGASTQS